MRKDYLRLTPRPAISLLVTASFVLATAFDCRGCGAAFPFQDQAAQQSSQDAASEISHWVNQLSSSDEEKRRAAAVMLAAMENPAAAAALLSALNDSSERVRAHAIAGLAALGDKSFVPAIASRLAQDKKPFVRKAAAYGLGRLRSAEGTAPLMAALKDKDIEVRGAAAVALGQYQDASAIPALIGALADKQEFVRAQSARALGVNGRASAQAVPNLVRLLTSDKDQEVKRQAATALGLIGERSALPALELAQHSSDPYLSQAALEAMNKIRGQGAGES
ncbi:MAG TPA: HEAT repeat domain-containing protein [Blastocatellia bacterium]|nr:HEAT repeat domain-containing protein [Blastocatellia bacterium]